jgi:two-component system OmpR family response regulator
VNGNSGRILVVDDDADFRAAVKAVVRRAGIDCFEAGTGGAAVDAARSERPVLVLLDVRLPDTNGYEICRELRDELGDDLPIIFVSGDRTDAIDRSAGMLVGGDDYVVKPFDPDELLARIRRLIERSGARAAGSNGTDDRGLTERELEVLTLLAAGRRPTEIAAGLVISEKTVSSHLQRVLA